jgi:hypothetical protein
MRFSRLDISLSTFSWRAVTSLCCHHFCSCFIRSSVVSLSARLPRHSRDTTPASNVDSLVFLLNIFRSMFMSIKPSFYYYDRVCLIVFFCSDRHSFSDTVHLNCYSRDRTNLTKRLKGSSCSTTEQRVTRKWSKQRHENIKGEDSRRRSRDWTSNRRNEKIPEEDNPMSSLFPSFFSCVREMKTEIESNQETTKEEE